MVSYNCIIFILILKAAIARCDKNTLPVFLIDIDKAMSHISEEPNPFARINTHHFGDIVQEAISLSEVVIIFIEDMFSSEDLSHRDKLGTPYSNLYRGLLSNQVKYLPAVIKPYKYLTKTFPQEKYNVFYIRSQSKFQIMDDSKYLYVYFQDGVNETRIEKLRRHDLIMKEVCSVIRQVKPGPVIGFYTGKVNPYGGKKKFVPIRPRPVPKKLGVIVVSSGALFRFSDVYTLSSTRRSKFSQRPMVAQETFDKRSMSTKMAYNDFELEFNFSFKDDGWIIDNVALLEAGEEVGRTDLGVGAPWNWSYVCGEPLLIVNTRDGSSVTISQYQVQPRLGDFRRYTNGLYQIMKSHPLALRQADTNFDKSVNCGPYFNANILAGLLVSFIVLGVTMIGVAGLVNCMSCNRFEDPSNKALIHEASH